MSAGETEETAGVAGDDTAADLVAAAFGGPEAEEGTRVPDSVPGPRDAEPQGSDGAAAEAVTAEVATAETVTTESVTTEVVSAETVTTEAATTEAVTAEVTAVAAQDEVPTAEVPAAQAPQAAPFAPPEGQAAQAPFGAPQPGPQGPYGGPGQPYGAPDQQYGAPGQPYGQPGQPLPPGAPPYGPHLDPAAFFSMLNADTAQAEAKARKRRVLKLALRYGLVLVTLGAIGAATAYAVTVPKRTDIPTLKTKDDGRYEFPGLTRPALPQGAPAVDDPKNDQLVHYADIRKYLLPAPAGATLDSKYPAAGGWVAPADFTAGYSMPEGVQSKLSDDGVRRIAARAWTTPDGQHTTIMLLQFPGSDAAADYITAAPGDALNGLGGDDGTPATVTVHQLGGATTDIQMHRFSTVAAPVIPAGAPAGSVGRTAMWQIGDAVVIVTTVAPKQIGDLPSTQIIQLQSEMLD